MRRRQKFAQAVVKQPVRLPLSPAEQYEQKFGKKPHHRMKPDTMLERVRNGDPR